MRRPSDGMTATHIAAMRGDLTCLNLLNNHKAQMSCRAFDTQETPSDLARLAGHRTVAKAIDAMVTPAPSESASQMAQRFTQLFDPVRKTARSLGLRI